MSFLEQDIVLKQHTIQSTKVRWILNKELKYKYKDEVITVPVGFNTDLAQVPRLLWVLVPPFGKYTAPAILHDYLYYTKRFQKKEQDKIFYDAMKDQGTNVFIRHQFYFMVKLFGNIGWNKTKQKLPK